MLGPPEPGQGGRRKRDPGCVRRSGLLAGGSQARHCLQKLSELRPCAGEYPRRREGGEEGRSFPPSVRGGQSF